MTADAIPPPASQEAPVYKKILIIDDDPVNNLICESLITKTGLAREVSSFLGATEALEWLLCQPPDTLPELILLDINMPIMDGWEFLKQVRARLPEPAFTIKILSSSVSEEDQAKAAAHDLVDEYLIKPLTQAHLSQLQAAAKA